MSYPSNSLIKTIKLTSSHWRFTPSKLPLLCKRANIILKLQKFTYQTPQYRFTNLHFSALFHRPSLHKFPKPNKSNHQNRFSHFIQQHFNQETLIFTDGSKSQLMVGVAVWIPSSATSLLFSLPSFTSIFHDEQTVIFAAILHIKNNPSSDSFLYQAHYQPSNPSILCP